MGGFALEATPSPPSSVASASEDEDDDDGDDDDADGDVSSTDEMSTLHSYPLSLMTKRGSSFGMRVVYLRGRVSIGPFLLGGVLIHFEGCSEDSMYLFFSFFLDILLLYMRSCDHL